MKKTIYNLISGSVLLIGSTQAAVINWGTATNVTDVTEVLNTGTTIEAVNASATTVNNTLLLNGVSFVSNLDLLSSNTGNDGYSGTTGNNDYDQFLSNFDFGGGTNLVTLTVANGLLINGDDYEIQVWYSNASGSRTTPFGDGESIVNGLDQNTVDLTAVAATPQFAIGTFTADSTSQLLTLNSPGFGNAHITGYQVRAVAVPEPSSTSLLGLGFASLLMRRRRTT